VDLQSDIETKHVLHRYLAHFYADRFVTYDIVLTFHGSRLRSQGAAFSDLLSNEEKQQRIIAYQGEMRALTLFLKSLLSL
jgi:hypothetical protein